MKARAVRAALVHERADRNIPAVIHFAEDIFSRHADIAEEQLVEFGFAGHLAERTNFDAWRFHVHKKNCKAFVLSGGCIGTNDELAPIAHPTVTGPDFL